MTLAKTLLGASALTLFAVPAFAAMSVTATTDLNVRAGPGPDYPVTSVIGNNQAATLDGCIENSKWCQVTINGTSGWAYSEYLVADYSGQPTVVYQNYQTIGAPVVTYDGPDGALAGGATGAVAGALVAGPVGAAVGGAAGAAIGGAVDPTPETRTYIQANPVDQVYLDGEVVVGSTVPQDVRLYDVPDAQYRYVYVNGQEVLVAPDTRQIVYVYR
ncbi:DUF1236 domain-containing protein [Pseudohoeflea suaedae]|uniref:DUF1236 domain-containing protein n=1 Tax=Pseudohoeflea suaedae TaxID=877384 RepID=A0A4R5PHM7_9HYPH|nr:DUF1236 domain-containing protein [Pseudohoeflea suaedae]TDH34333.1 DUF1236 domain-containing protein [Pseudohoeflea suaedae]